MSDKLDVLVTTAIFSPALMLIKLNGEVSPGVYSVKQDAFALHKLAPEVFAKPADTALGVLENLQKIVTYPIIPGDVFVYTNVEVRYIEKRAWIVNQYTSVDRVLTATLRKQLRIKR